jgi:hypothetical protein
VAARATELAQVERVQEALETWLASRAPIEKRGIHKLWSGRTIDQDLMITVQTNSQPPEGTDKLGRAVNTLYEIVREPIGCELAQVRELIHCLTGLCDE